MKCLSKAHTLLSTIVLPKDSSSFGVVITAGMMYFCWPTRIPRQKAFMILIKLHNSKPLMIFEAQMQSPEVKS